MLRPACLPSLPRAYGARGGGLGGGGGGWGGGLTQGVVELRDRCSTPPLLLHPASQPQPPAARLSPTHLFRSWGGGTRGRGHGVGWGRGVAVRVPHQRLGHCVVTPPTPQAPPTTRQKTGSRPAACPEGEHNAMRLAGLVTERRPSRARLV